MIFLNKTPMTLGNMRANAGPGALAIATNLIHFYSKTRIQKPTELQLKDRKNVRTRRRIPEGSSAVPQERGKLIERGRQSFLAVARRELAEARGGPR